MVWLWAVILWLGAAVAVAAQDAPTLARIEVEKSAVRDRRGGVSVELALSQAVPWRLFTLDAPWRLALDLRGVEWSGTEVRALLRSGRATDLHIGTAQPGWTRMVVDLAEPLMVEEAGMGVDPATGAARLSILLRPTDPETFAARATVPDPATVPFDPAPDRPEAPLVVAIDPGHGGIDPGAQRGSVREADLMLQLARDLARGLRGTGRMRPVLTREADMFVPLEERMTIARAAGADVLISLHADALEEDAATGASVYTLTAEAAEEAGARLVERHDPGDLLAGVDLSGQGDRVAGVLMELARLETAPQSERLAAALVANLRQSGAALNTRPRRKAELAVLMAADFPSVLLEAGFLSSDADRARLTDAHGRAQITAGIVAGLRDWAAEEAALAPLLRQ